SPDCKSCKATGYSSENALPLYFKYFFNLSLIVVTIICIAVSIYGGVLYLISGGSPVTMAEAKGWIFSGILGLVILFTSYLILVTINPQLVIFKIPGITPPQEGPPPTISPPTIEKTIYQEIPIGTLVENILAKNIDCYDYSTSTGDMIDTDPSTTSTIDKIKDHDRLDCLKKLAEAVRTKSEELKKLAEELKALIDRCSCSPPNCVCSCVCPGIPTPCTGDPCPDRPRINELREEIKKLVTGEGAPLEFLNIREGIKRLKEAKKLLEEDLNTLIEAENLMKWKCQYGTILNLVKFFDLKETLEYIDKTEFDDIDMKKYCIEFNCIEFEDLDDPKKKFCTKYELATTTGRICKATTTPTTIEYYVFDGDPATFYCLFERISGQELIGQEPEEKCVISADIENGFERGKIPIGELVDYTELYASTTIFNIDNMIENAQIAADAAYNEKTNEDLYDLPPEFKCSNCTPICHCIWFLGVCISCTCKCTGICGPFDKVAARVNEIKEAYDKIDTANTNIANLVMAEGKITDEQGNEMDIPDQLNRWKLLNALTNSRNKLEKCITGYGKVLKTGMTQMTLLNCMIALDKINREELLILPGFEYLTPTWSDYCYPYNSEYFLDDNQRKVCRRNKDSEACKKIVKDLMQNFFCCEGARD
ncbi:hypothetical protein KJA17_00910, partial [Patescibacteria group bacterium]|nr:hypothetical protein [Patescibacteria group bacterium]